MSMVVRIAEEKDLLPIQRLVAKAGLEEKGIEHQINDFLVIEDSNQQIVGTVGIERLGEDGLLRSLVIRSENLDAKVSLEFLEVTLAFAKRQKVKNLYLLTKSALPIFEYLGFEEIPGESIPAHIENSQHFSQYVKGVTKVMATKLEK
ncbi:GNAT family N-acetyltransferase [Bacillus alkalicellulosilyticus]|uniref:GNAT family N-acetyltransferase n=1 Tax=Alkalihalobacterium alkalicellulosilyticum TaxID=1912214 RepID=UPI00099878B5|nr:hypothetical protein [Bacillus alkalicellulosilyticus]